MSDVLLILNSGSSSLKFSVFDSAELSLRFSGQVEGIGTSPRLIMKEKGGKSLCDDSLTANQEFHQADAIGLILEQVRARIGHDRLVAVGHRIVHGGVKYASPVQLNAIVVADLERIVPLAPLHIPSCLAVIKTIFSTQPDLPQVACFDTAFHRTQPELAQRFALPRQYTDEGVRRYGFHGLSYEYIASVLPGIDQKAAAGRTVIAHLGNGASLCALLAGRSVATTMSFTPVDGLVMGTRVGSLDPGVLLYLMSEHGLDAAALEKLMYHESGLLGVSGVSSDMRTLIASDNPHAADAIDLFVYRFGRELGSLMAALGGLDALVFTGGIGENAALIRSKICHNAAWAGLYIDDEANQNGSRRLSRSDSQVAIWVVPTNEELMIAQHTRRVLNLAGH